MTDAKAEAPILWPTYIKSQLTGKDTDAGKDLRQKEKGVAENEMVKYTSLLVGACNSLMQWKNQDLYKII